MKRLTEHFENKKMGAYMVCLGACIDDDFDCNSCEKLAEIVDRLAAYEDTGLEPDEASKMAKEWTTYETALSYVDEIGGIEHLRELAQVEKDGRLMVLPCKVGDVVYELNKRGFISTYKVISIRISYCSVLIGWELIDGIYSNLNGFEVSALGKTVFLTREEAETALERWKEEQHDD